MKKELDELLCERYPKIFKDRYGNMQETCMCWGFDVGDGWFNIIDTMCYLIQNHIDSHNKSRKRDIDYNDMLSKNDDELLRNYYSDFVKSEYVESYVQRAKEGGYRNIQDEMYQVVAIQVKEKYGGLRFYYSGGDDYIHGIVAMAENLSDITCEQCGKPGKQNKEGWIVTLCDDCRGYKLENEE